MHFYSPWDIPETRESEKYLRTLFYLRGPGRPAVYAVKKRYISAAEKNSKETI